jgi:hypothetical protein
MSKLGAFGLRQAQVAVEQARARGRHPTEQHAGCRLGGGG